MILTALVAQWPARHDGHRHRRRRADRRLHERQKEAPEKLESVSKKPNTPFEHRISDFSLDDVYRAVERSRATIYTVVPEYRFLNRSLDQQVNAMNTMDRPNTVKPAPFDAFKLQGAELSADVPAKSVVVLELK